MRYEILTDVTKQNGQRKRLRTRKNVDGRPLATEAMARAELARIQNDVATHNFVARRRVTVEEACEQWLGSKHGLKPSTLRCYEMWLAPLRQELGHVELQQLEKHHINTLIDELKLGKVPGYKSWGAGPINGMLGRFHKLMEDARKQGHIQRNVVELVDRLPQDNTELNILSEADMFKILDHPDRDRHVWALALYGLRRGEMAGLRWEQVDFTARTLSITENRVTVGKDTYTGTPKSKASKRILPMPDELYDLLIDAQARIESEYVVCDERGKPLTGTTLSSRWTRMLQRLEIKHVRLHDARHSCASLLHARGVPVATIAAWLGHASSAFTMSRYVHSQDAALIGAAQSYRQ